MNLIRTKRFWIALSVICAVASWFATLPIQRDYRRTTFLRSQVAAIALGTETEEIIAILGQPDARWPQPDSAVTWIYCSKFDWDGVRSRWTDQPFLEYWQTRLSGEIDEQHDAVIELRLRDGVLESIENSVPENLLGYYPKLSL